jgi:hypothetical protein
MIREAIARDKKNREWRLRLSGFGVKWSQELTAKRDLSEQAFHPSHPWSQT